MLNRLPTTVESSVIDLKNGHFYHETIVKSLLQASPCAVLEHPSPAEDADHSGTRRGSYNKEFY